MLIQSMTGFGMGEAGNFRVEIRSSNHKSLDIQINVPSYLYCYEAEIRKFVKQKIHRGRIEIYVRRQEEKTTKVKVNKSLAMEYYNALVTLKDELSISENIGFNFLASQRGIFSLEEQDVKIRYLYDALEIALDELKKMRAKEGKNLINDITKKVKLITSHITCIKNKRKEFISNAKKRLYERLKEFLGNMPIDDSRLIQETAILIERSDFTEEIVRIKSHLSYIKETLKSGKDAVGKKIDFLTQELRREINTIGSKSSDIEITRYVVEMKNELEKIREQIQNLQ